MHVIECALGSVRVSVLNEIPVFAVPASRKIGTYLLIQGAAGRESSKCLTKVNVSWQAGAFLLGLCEWYIITCRNFRRDALYITLTYIFAYLLQEEVRLLPFWRL